MTNKREEMIEEAAKAMWEVKYGDVPPDVVPERTEVMQMARAALAVFEQSHTPTNDERCRVIADMLRFQFMPDAVREYLTSYLEAGEPLRRPVQGEPECQEVSVSENVAGQMSVQGEPAEPVVNPDRLQGKPHPGLRRVISEALRETHTWSESTQAVFDAVTAWLAAHDAEKRAEWEAEQGGEQT